MSGEISQSKTALREEVRARVRAISPEQRTVRSAQLCARLKQLEIWSKARTILFFAPMPDEPDIWPLLADAIAEGKQVALPHFDGEPAGYSARLIRNTLTDTHIGRFGIREPLPTCPVQPLNQLDLILVPGVAFEPSGRRLGRGKGFYDRLLALAGGETCGVAFDEQIVHAIPHEPHDICLNHILTPSR